MGRQDLNSFVDTCVTSNQYTADMPVLQHKLQFTPVFVYASEKFGFSEHHYVRDWPLLGRGCTLEKNFLMFEHKHHYPIVCEKPDAPTANRIYGELRLVSPEVLYCLDATYERGRCTKRFRRKVEFSSEGSGKILVTHAYIYLHIWDAFADGVAEGELPLMKPFVEQMTKRTAYMWLLSDDIPNQKRIAELREAQKLRLEKMKQEKM